MEGKITVFISSIQDKQIEDIESERNTVVNTVDNYPPTAAWAFERMPASDLQAQEYFLRGVRDCDLFFLVFGGQITESVRKEYDEAVHIGKPIFVFVKDTPRTKEAEDLFSRVHNNSKYASFKTVQDLTRLVETSLNSFLRRLVKDYNEQVFTKTSASFESEITHYLNLVPESLREVSKFYVPLKARLENDVLDTIDNILMKHRRIKLLGPAGSGKTTELLNFAARLSRRAIEETESRQITVYVDMADWIEGDLISHLEKIFKEYGFNFGRPTVESLLREYEVVLLFDGLDEIPPLELSEKVRQIKSASTIYEGIEIIISCRTTRCATGLDFCVAYLEPLQDADIVSYLSEFSRGKFTLGRLYSWPSYFRELLRHPLTLRFIANIIAEGATKPTSLAGVYEQYISFLFDRWETRKGANIDPIWKRKALVNVAVDMQKESRYSVSEEVIIGLLQKVLSGEHVTFSSVDLLNELVSSGIIRSERNRYTFWHASFREYLASQLLINKIRDGEAISEFVSSSAWEPVTIFASGLFDNSSEMRRFLFEILDVDLYLYIRCLANAPPLSFAVTLSDDELSHLILREMLEVRNRIIEQWVPSLFPMFIPYTYHGTNSEPAVVGKFSSEGGGYLEYGYTTEKKVGSKVCLLSDLPSGTFPRDLIAAGILHHVTRGIPINEAGVLKAHSIALDDIWRELEDILRKKALIEPPRLMYEQIQAEANYLFKNHTLPINIQDAISSIGEEINQFATKYGAGRVTLQVGGENIELNILLLKLKGLAKSGWQSINAPLLPQPDRVPSESNWVTQFYEDETLVEYVKQYFHHFLEGYSELVQLNFPKLSQRLQLHQLLPVRVVAEIERPAPSKDIESLGGCNYYFEPLESISQNEVVVSLNQQASTFISPSSKNLQSAMDRWGENLKRYGRWNSSTTVWTCRSLLSVFFGEHNPIRHGVYERILNDLREIFEVAPFQI